MDDNQNLAGGESGGLDDLATSIENLYKPGPDNPGNPGAAEGSGEVIDDLLADTAPDGGVQKDEGDDAPKGLTPEAQAAFDQRIDKEVGKRKALETERDTAKTRVTELEAQVKDYEKRLEAVTAADKPLDLVETEDDLTKHLATLKSNEDVIKRLIGEGGGEVGGQFFEVPALEKALLKIEMEREHAVPAAREKMKVRAAETDKIRKAFPSLFQEGSESNKAAKALLAEFPAIRKRADYWKFIATHLVGERHMKARAAGQQPAVVQKPRVAAPPPAPPRNSAAPRSPNASGGARGENRYRSNYDEPDGEASDKLAIFIEQAGFGT